jgi:hypothetical protein
MTTSKRFALQKKRVNTEDKIEYASYIGWYGEVVPHIPIKLVSNLQEASLFGTIQLEAMRKDKSTRSLLEEYLPEFELVEVVVSMKENHAGFEPGDLVYSLDVNTKARIYATVTRIEIDQENGQTKVFHIEEDGTDSIEGFDSLEGFTLVCKAFHRLDI